MSVVRVSLSKLRDQALNVGRPTADTSSSEPCTQLIVNIHKLHPFTEGQHCSKCEIHITHYSPPTVVETSVWSSQCVWGNRKDESIGVDLVSIVYILHADLCCESACE